MTISARMRNILHRIDILRLAGIDTIVGVDLSEKGVRMVVLKRHGNVLNKYKSTYSVEMSGCVSFHDDETRIEQKAKALRHLLMSRNVTARLAVSTLRSHGVKTISTLMPMSVKNVDEWLVENYEKLVKLPLPLKEIAFQHEVLESSDAGTLIEITFVRRSEIDVHRELFKKVGLELIAVGAGVRDVVTAAILSEPSMAEKDILLAHLDGTNATIVPLKMGRRRQTSHVCLLDEGDPGGALMKSRQDAGIASDLLYVMGDVSEKLVSLYREFRPLGLFSEYALATGLSLKGFLPEVSPTNFLNGEEQERVAVSTYQTLSKRTALGLGCALFVLLFMQFVVSYFIQSKIDRLDDELATSGSAYAEIALLDQHVRSLENDLGDNGKSRSSNHAQTMYKLAKAVPDNVWLTKCTLDAGNSNPGKLTITGVARSNEQIAVFLKRLRTSKLCANVKLVRSGSPQQNDGYETASSKSNSLVGFELTANVID